MVGGLPSRQIDIGRMVEAAIDLAIGVTLVSVTGRVGLAYAIRHALLVGWLVGWLVGFAEGGAEDQAAQSQRALPLCFGGTLLAPTPFVLALNDQ